MNPTHTPTEPGSYYWRWNENSPVEIVNVHTRFDELKMWRWGCDNYEDLDGEWLGKVPEWGTAFTVGEISTWILGEQLHCMDGTEPAQARFREQNKLLRFLAEYLSDPEDGIAATTQRNKEG